MGKAREIVSQIGQLDGAALAALERAAVHDTGGGLVTVSELARGAALYELLQDGDVVLRYLLRVDMHEHGAEAVILAAAGGAPGVDATRAGIADVEARIAAVPCASIMTVTRRMGLVKKLARLGFTVDGFILRKRLQCH